MSTTPEIPAVLRRTDTVRRNVGTCPACRAYLWAEVVVVTTLQSPHWRDETAPQPAAYADPVAATLDHQCDSREGDWQ